jgi:hypothetical protein
MKPTYVQHCDWGTVPNKRWRARAKLQADGSYTTESIELAGDLTQLIPSIQQEIGPTECALMGFDFPIGIPAPYADAAGIEHFKSFLTLLGLGQWTDFFSCATRASEISLHRPFYPFIPGGTKQSQLLGALGLPNIDDLRRKCEKKHSGRRAACPLFWTLGANQVGKAAIVGWRDVLVPAIKAGKNVLLWPFDGPLDELLQPGNVVICETYPAEYYRSIFSEPLKSKRKREFRRGISPALLNWATGKHITFETAVRQEIETGFSHGDDDAFDAVIGLLGMLEVVTGNRRTCDPAEEEVIKLEGWIFGQSVG